MNKFLFAVAALAFVIAGCASIRVGPEQTVRIGERTFTIVGVDGFNPDAVRKPNPHQPNVFITEQATIVVDQEPIRPNAPVSEVFLLVWALESRSDYVFPDDTAITFINAPGSTPPSTPPSYKCAVVMPRKKVISCTYDKPSAPLRWKYAIKVTNEKTGTPLTALDPWIYQN